MLLSRVKDFLREQGFLNETNDMIIEIGLKRLFELVSDFVLAILVSGYFGDWIVGVIFELCYMAIRIYAGGYHASMEQICKYLTHISTIVCIWAIFFLRITNLIQHTLVVVSMVLLVLMAPVESENKPINRLERKKFYRNCMCILILEIILYFVFVFLNKYIYAKTIYIALQLVVIGLLAEKIRQYKRSRISSG